MSTTNHRMVLPGGAVAVRVDNDGGGRRYHIGPGGAVLTAADVEVLFADSIADDGGAELQCAERSGSLLGSVRCLRIADHLDRHVAICADGAPVLWTQR